MWKSQVTGIAMVMMMVAMVNGCNTGDNSFNTASSVSITAGTFSNSYTGCVQDTVDYYALQSSLTGDYVYDIQIQSNSSSASAAVYDRFSALIVQLSWDVNGDLVGSVSVNPANTYYIVVNPDSTDYTLSISPVSCQSDSLEPNTQWAPVSITEGVYTNLNVCPGVNDYYTVTASKSGYFVVSTSAAVNIQVWGTVSGTLLATGILSVSTGINSGDMVTIVISTVTSSSYNLTAISTSCTDAISSNDVYSLANAINVGPMYSGITICSAASDWYSFVAPSTSGVVVVDDFVGVTLGSVYTADLVLLGNSNQQLAFSAGIKYLVQIQTSTSYPTVYSIGVSAAPATTSGDSSSTSGAATEPMITGVVTLTKYSSASMMTVSWVAVLISLISVFFFRV